MSIQTHFSAHISEYFLTCGITASIIIICWMTSILTLKMKSTSIKNDLLWEVKQMYMS